MPKLTYPEVALDAAAKMVDLLHDRAPQGVIQIRHAVESWLNCLDDSVFGAVIPVTYDQENHPGDLTVELILLVLVHRLTQAIVVTRIAAVEACAATAGLLSGRLLLVVSKVFID